MENAKENIFRLKQGKEENKNRKHLLFDFVALIICFPQPLTPRALGEFAGEIWGKDSCLCKTESRVPWGEGGGGTAPYY